MSKRASFLILMLVLVGAGLRGSEPVRTHVGLTPGPSSGEHAGPTPSAALTAHLSVGFVKYLVVQTTEDAEEIVERMVRADVRGTARTKSDVDVELIEDPGRVLIDLVVRGTTVTDSIGWRGPAKIYTTSHTPFVARKRMRVDAGGVNGGVPSIEVTAKLCLDRITNRDDHVRFPLAGVAQRIYRRSEGEANHEVECNARQRVRERIDRAAAPYLKDVGLGYAAFLSLVDTQLQGRPHRMHYWSTANGANVAVEMTGAGRGDPVSPPDLPAGWDVGFRMHETMTREAAQTALAGKSYALGRLENLGDELLEWLQAKLEPEGKKAAPKGEDGVDEDAVSVTFARQDPLRIRFAGDRIEIVLCTSNYRAGGEDYQGFRVRMSYRIETNPQPAAVREGQPEIEAIGEPTAKQKKLPRTEYAFLRQAFRTGTERIAISEIHLPAAWNKTGRLTPHTLLAKNDWLVVTWRMK